MRLIALLCLAATTLLVVTEARSQDYPTRPIHVILASSPGGTSDVFMRALEAQLQKRLGQPIIIDNRPGGRFIIGGRACAEAPNDGYTLCLLSNETLVSDQFLFKKLPYDPRAFEPITNLIISDSALVVSSKLHVKTIDELIAYSKAHPGTLSYVCPVYSFQAVLERLKRERGADWVGVPFSGGAEATTGLLSGTTPIAYFGLQNFMSLLRSGDLTGLAVDRQNRSPLFPNIPTLSELGFHDPLNRVYFALVAPPGTPKAITNKIRDEISIVYNQPDFEKKQMTERGLTPALGSADDLTKYLAEDREVFKRVVAELGLQPQ